MVTNCKFNDIAPLLSVNEVAIMFHIHPNTLRRWSDQGIIRSFRLNSRGDRRYRRFDVYHFLLKLRTQRAVTKKARNIDIDSKEIITGSLPA